MPRLTLTALLAAVLALTGGAACSQAAGELATLHASFSPDRLGASTTIGFSFDLASGQGTAPPPLTALDLRIPAGMGYASTTLGLALCQPDALIARGPGACPANSRLGSGSARVEVPFGAGAGREIPEIQAVAGPSAGGNLRVLFYANGLYPIDAQLAFEGEVLPDHGRYGSQLAANIPLVASVAGGPDVSIVHAQVSLGPNHLTYYRHSHGRLIPFHPRGIAVPAGCPRGGFPFAATFTFQDTSTANAHTTVPCPTRHAR